MGLLVSVGVAALTGLAFLAYKRHGSYQAISKNLSKISWFLMAAGFIFFLGFETGRIEEYKNFDDAIVYMNLWLIGWLAFWLLLLLFDYIYNQGDKKDHSS